MTVDAAQGELVRQLDRLEKLVSAAREVQAPSSVGNAQIVVSAGGVGVWLCALMASVCFVTTIVMAILYVDHSRRIDDLGHYLQAIYQVAPELKPQEN